MLLRLDKFLSETTGFSRTEIKNAIHRGEAEVNSKVVLKNDYKIDAEKDKIVFFGDEIIYKKYVYLMLNKPSGILSASNDASRKTVIDLVPSEYKHYDLFPVGRLDKYTTGLLLITNDGEFAHRVISPKSNIEKSYIVTVDNKLDPEIIQKFDEGIILADGTVCKSAKLEILSNDTLRIIITEGKYHQIKRMLGTVGLGVLTLHRERIGNITIPDNLSFGEVCELSIKKWPQFFNILPRKYTKLSIIDK